MVFAARAHPYVWSSYALEKADKSACLFLHPIFREHNHYFNYSDLIGLGLSLQQCCDDTTSHFLPGPDLDP